MGTRTHAGWGVFLAVLLAVLVSPSWARADDDAGVSGDAGVTAAPSREPVQTERVLRVGVAGAVPFVIPAEQEGDEPQGFSVDVWRAVAEHNHWAYRYLPIPRTDQMLRMLAAGELDVAVGPTSITADRARTVAFSQPYQDASLAIVSPAERGIGSRIRPLLSRALWIGGASLGFVLLLVGTLVWLAERRRNPDQFPPSPAAGIGNGVWLALVTMTTVGYGDRAPMTPLGRLITGLWMLAALVITSSLTASITTTLTVWQLDPAAVVSARDLRGRRVGTVRGTTSERFVGRQEATLVPFPTLAGALESLRRREVSAVVFDRPVLRHHLSTHPEDPLQLSTASYEPQGYGFAVPHGSPLRVPIDVSLLTLRQRGNLAALAARWLGEATP